MKSEDYKYNLELKIENMTFDQMELLKAVLDTIQNVQYKTFNKILKTQGERTSI